ncbi:hypothetical protein DVH24_025469 [Malus domestica]|uniref:Uncharacterized protein n=1 Tax=Malus domestica TaxID=3750 RepID=A0A498HKC1_MALDO|nr:hypothetical protein DVH24_025469 [Malus domestica]
MLHFILMLHFEEEGGEQNENEDHFDILANSHSIFGTQILNEQVQDDQKNEESVKNEERNADITYMDATEIDRVINDVINFQPEEAVPKETPGSSIEQSIPSVRI